MFSLSGELNRKEYFRRLISSYAVFIVCATPLIYGLRSIRENRIAADISIKIVVTFMLGILLAGSLIWLFVIFSLMVKRARNAGNATLYTAVALLASPIGFIAIGFLPPQTQTTKKRP